MTAISISRLHYPVTTLGPGNRVGIWFQGCSIRCPGCISADTWAEGRGMTTVEDVIMAVSRWLPACEGITISGGEPFDQPKALRALLQELRRLADVDVLVYSGHPFERIVDTVQRTTGLIDALITDPFEIEQPQTMALRGSDNQRLHLLTERGRARFGPYERQLRSDDRKFDLMMGDDGEVWMAGIPGRDDFRKLSAMLADQHHRILTSEDRSIVNSDQRSR